MFDNEKGYLTTNEIAKRFKLIMDEIDRLKKVQNAKPAKQKTGKSVEIEQIFKLTKPELFDGTFNKLLTFLI